MNTVYKSTEPRRPVVKGDLGGQGPLELVRFDPVPPLKTWIIYIYIYIYIDIYVCMYVLYILARPPCEVKPAAGLEPRFAKNIRILPEHAQPQMKILTSTRLPTFV